MNEKPGIDPEATYVAIDSFAGDVPALGFAPVVQRGQKLRGSNPIVEAHPHYFVEDGADDQAQANARHALTPSATGASESAERRRRNSVSSLRQAVIDRERSARELAEADEQIAKMKRKAEGEDADERDIEKALEAKPATGGGRGLHR